MFVAGTDTDVGKTYVTAGLAVSLRKLGVDVGVMKPFAAGTSQKKGFKSEDVEIIAKAAQVDDPESLTIGEKMGVTVGTVKKTKDGKEVKSYKFYPIKNKK